MKPDPSSLPASSADTPEHTFVFADLAGFTALTEAMGDADAADLASDFYAAVQELVKGTDCEAVKLIGDAAMLRSSDAACAIELATKIVFDIGGRHSFPVIRAGLHSGPAVSRDGDWFGATVNIAARVSAEAAGAEVLLSDATRQAAGSIEGLEMLPRGRRSLKNVAEPVLLFAAARTGAGAPTHLPVDPVCRMAVDPEHSAGQLTWSGAVFHFCSLQCAKKFASRPETYVN